MTESNQEYVYAIAHPHGYVKIGRSKDPKRRLKEHQSSSPYDLWVLVQVPVQNSPDIEKELHDAYSDKSIRGEWFELDYSDYDELSEMMNLAASGKEIGSINDLETHRRKRREAVFQ